MPFSLQPQEANSLRDKLVVYTQFWCYVEQLSCTPPPLPMAFRYYNHVLSIVAALVFSSDDCVPLGLA